MQVIGEISAVRDWGQGQSASEPASSLQQTCRGDPWSLSSLQGWLEVLPAR